jgi:hypothetical protein
MNTGPSLEGTKTTSAIDDVKYKNIKVKMSLRFEHHAMKVYLWSGGIIPRIPDLDTRWR